MAVTAQMRTQVSHLYLALFGRAPDGQGLAFWAGRLDGGDGVDSLIGGSGVDTYIVNGVTAPVVNTQLPANADVIVENGSPVSGDSVSGFTGMDIVIGFTPGVTVLQMAGTLKQVVGMYTNGVFIPKLTSGTTVADATLVYSDAGAIGLTAGDLAVVLVGVVPVIPGATVDLNGIAL